MTGNKDPFGGNLTRLQILAPPGKEGAAEKIPSYREKANELKASSMENADRDAMELEAARLRTETAKLELQRQELVARFNGATAGGAAPAPFTGTTKKLIDLLQLGTDLGIDVTPLIQRVLTGKDIPVTAQPSADLAGIPNPILTSIGKMMEKSFEHNTTPPPPQESVELAVLKEKMKSQELLVNKELEGIRNILLTQRGEVKDPNQVALDNIKNFTALVAAVKAMEPAPPAAAAGGINNELAFKYQDREWQHEEKKLEAEVKRQEIAATMHTEQQKLEQSRSNISQIPEMIGAVVAQSIMESGKKGPAPAAPAATQNPPVDVKLKKSKDKPHDVITIKCQDCKQAVSFMTSAKSANCINCGTVYRIHLEETEGGATSLETMNESEPAAPPAPESAGPSDRYLLRGM